MTLKNDYTKAVEEYNKGARLKDLAKKYSLTRVGMLYALRRLGVTLRDERVKIDEDAAVCLYQQGLRMQDIATKYGCTLSAVSLALKRRNVSIRKGGEINKDIEMVLAPSRKNVSDLVKTRRRKKSRPQKSPAVMQIQQAKDELEDFLAIQPDMLPLIEPQDPLRAFREFQKVFSASVQIEQSQVATLKDGLDNYDDEYDKIQSFFRHVDCNQDKFITKLQ